MVADARFVVNVEAAVHRDGEYLLVERAAGEEHAAGELALVGGTVECRSTNARSQTREDTVEPDESGEDVLAATVRREIREETGVEVGEAAYVTSARFESDRGTPCVNVVLLGRHRAGDGEVREREEVAAVHWRRPADVDDAPPYTREYVAAAERRRAELGW